MLSLLSLVILLGIIAGCGGDDSAGGADGPKIVYITTVLDPFTNTVAKGAEAEAARLGADFDFEVPSKLEVVAQTATLNAAIAKQPDAILISPIDGKAMQEPLRRAKERGITIVTISSDTPDKSARDTFIAPDFTEGGRMAGRELLRLVHGRGTVSFLSAFTGFTFFDQTEAGFKEVVGADAGVDLLPTRLTEGNLQKTVSIIKATVTRYPNLAGIAGVIDPAAAVTALRPAGKLGKVKVLVYDGMPNHVKLLREGRIDAIMSYAAREIGALAVEQAVRAIDGKKLPEQVDARLCLLTRANIDDPKNAACIFDEVKS